MNEQTRAERKAGRCRERAEAAAAAGTWDWAVELYGTALLLSPDDLSLHQGLRELGLRRKAAGGRPMGWCGMSRVKSARGHLLGMIAWERALARDPGNTDHMVKVRNAALACGKTEVAKWMAEILRAASRAQG